MEYEWNTEKAKKNATGHGVSFEDLTAIGFDWDSAVIVEVARKDYGEERFNAYGFIGERLHVMAFTMRGTACRVISLRKANNRERRFYNGD